MGKGIASKIDTELEARKGTAFFSLSVFPCVTCSTYLLEGKLKRVVGKYCYMKSVSLQC